MNTNLILNDQGGHLDTFVMSVVSFRTLRGLLFNTPATGQDFFLESVYNEVALVDQRVNKGKYNGCDHL